MIRNLHPLLVWHYDVTCDIQCSFPCDCMDGVKWEVQVLLYSKIHDDRSISCHSYSVQYFSTCTCNTVINIVRLVVPNQEGGHSSNSAFECKGLPTVSAGSRPQKKTLCNGRRIRSNVQGSSEEERNRQLSSRVTFWPACDMTPRFDTGQLLGPGSLQAPVLALCKVLETLMLESRDRFRFKNRPLCEKSTMIQV